MELWWRARGWVRLKLTSADCSGRLREMAAEVHLEDIRFVSDLVVTFSVSMAEQERLRVRDGETLETVGSGGLPVVLGRLRRWWAAAAAVLLLGALTVFLQGRILFLRVEGNERVPARLILERAEECGVCFGAPIRELRSEQVKNHLLWALPELKWAGVNVSGCNAVITVAERQRVEEPEAEGPGDIVAAMDAMVTDILPQTGTALVSPGQAVRAGDVLISGATDLGLLVRKDRAEGEIYGLTRRTVVAALPLETAVRRENGREVKKYSLRIGKKYVNFSNDSGILHGTCVKMRTVKDLTLPGGFRLPVALVTDTYRLCECSPVSREMDAGLLMEEVRRMILDEMIAGTILREEMETAGSRMRIALECRELIGIFRPGIITEGDTNDRENRERGAG